MPSRRCSGELTRKSPPNDQNAWPPRLCSPSWSSRMTRLPASAISVAATSPASPPPTTITSASAIAPSSSLVAWHEARHFLSGQRQKALACGGGATQALVNLFHFGTFSAKRCSTVATLDLNLNQLRLHPSTKKPFSNTLSPSASHETFRFGFDGFGW